MGWISKGWLKKRNAEGARSMTHKKTPGKRGHESKKSEPRIPPSVPLDKDTEGFLFTLLTICGRNRFKLSGRERRHLEAIEEEIGVGHDRR
jgi:hypothetical protein